MILVLAMCLHHYAHGMAVFTLKQRSHFKDGGSVEMPTSVDLKIKSYVVPSTPDSRRFEDETASGSDLIAPEVSERDSGIIKSDVSVCFVGGGAAAR